MAAGDVYYQVWMHCGQEARVRVVETYKNSFQAQQSADRRNAAEQHDCPPNKILLRFYFVQPVTEEYLREALAEKYRRHISEDRQLFMQRYGGELKTYAREMVSSMLYSIETCDMGRQVKLETHGGWLEGYRQYADGIGYVECSALYSGKGDVNLEVAIVRGEETDAIMVGSFDSERALKSWLLNAMKAAAACENRLIDIMCDRYRQHAEE